MPAQAISWKNVEDSWKGGVETVNGWMDEVGNEFDKLSNKLKDLETDIRKIKISTPKVDWHDLEGRLELPKLEFDNLEADFDPLKKLQEIRIGGTLGKVSMDIKQQVSMDMFDHWGEQISECFKEFGRVEVLCRYRICREPGAHGMTLPGPQNLNERKCERAAARNRQQQIKAEIAKESEKIRQNLKSKTQRLRDELDRLKKKGAQ